MPPNSEQYAQLATLFTTNADSQSSTSIELLLPAHLPVQGGLWLVPYAGREAQDGNAMLVRMHDETIDVAVIGKNACIDLTACTSIEDVIEQVDIPITNWIVQPPADADPTSLLHCDADCVTLLSGADQAAVVGAYRLLKGIIAVSGESEVLPPIRLVIVGAEERASSEAASRIAQTAHHQLGIQLETGQPLPAMSSGSNVISQVSFARTSNVVDLMSRLRITTDKEVVEDALPTTHRFKTEETEPVRTQVIEEPNETIEQVVAEQEKVVIQNNYSSHIEGLLSISPRCPEYDHIELGVDGDGRLHVLAQAKEFRDASIVVSWVVRHHTLLSMACGGLQLDTSSSPEQHLFTDDAVSVADLHGSGVRLHLLTEVEVEGNKGVYCTPLN